MSRRKRSSRRLSVALVWHMHQPYYRDDSSGEFLLPWVRLRATKDYHHMFDVIGRHPQARVTINMAPSLLEQLAAYSDGDVADYHRDICRRDVSTLDSAERTYIVDMARRSGFSRRVAEFSHLYDLCDRLDAADPAALDANTMRDLQVWLQLGWIDPGVIRRRPELYALTEKGGGFTEADKASVDAVQRHLVATTIPAYQALVASGAVGAMTCPAYHPILPLLIDSKSARVGAPGVDLPEPGWAWRDDADAQIAAGLAMFEQHTGMRPTGAWSPECAVSPASVEALAAHGYTWSLSDEAVLSASLGRSARQDGDLYRPHRTASGLTMVFRDADLSDRIGFLYAGMPADDAVADLVASLESIADRQPASEDWLVTIALDGENCWDFYADNGAPFLEGLYTALVAHDRLDMVLVEDFLKTQIDIPVLSRLHSGSWIDADFTTWVGDPVHTTAWSLLIAARAALDGAGGADGQPTAHRELLIAEGSDWFWWLGHSHDSGMDDAWDALFRAHLRNAYVAMGFPIPTDLELPILEAGLAAHVAPLRSIDPETNGAVDWRCAGRIDLRVGLGSMHPPRAAVDAVEYGSSASNLHVRLVGGRADDVALIVERDGMQQRVSFTEAGVAHHTLAAGPALFHVEGGPPGSAYRLTPPGGVSVDIVAASQRRRCIVILTAELAPDCRVGELGDISAALAARVGAAGHDCVVVVPGHRALLRGGGGVRLPYVNVSVGERREGARILQRRYGRANVLIVDVPEFFDQRPVYDDILDAQRYVGFARCAVDVMTAIDLRPDAVICLEWQTALAAALVRQRGGTSVFAHIGPEPVRHVVAPGLIAAAGLDPGWVSEIDLFELGANAANAVIDARTLATDPLGIVDQALSSTL